MFPALANTVFSNVGAVAQLLDISCTFNTPDDEDLQDAFVLGDHFFITNPKTGKGISPFFERTQGEKVFAVLNKEINAPAPNTQTDVDWLKLDEFEGDWAQTVFRVQTRGGQPPSSCDGDEAIDVPYQAQYCEYIRPSPISGF